MPRPADRRAKIELLRAAEAVFIEHGLAAAKVEDITARAGVSKGAFYLHFDSKEDCWREIVEGLLARMADSLTVPAPDGAAGLEELVEQLDARLAHDIGSFEFIWQNRALLGMVLGGGGGAGYSYLVEEFAGQLATQIESWARHMTAVGVYRSDLDVTIVSALIAGGYDRLARRLIREPRRPDLESWCRQAQELFTRALFTDEARAILDRVVRRRPEPRPTAAPASGAGERPARPVRRARGK